MPIFLQLKLHNSLPNNNPNNNLHNKFLLNVLRLLPRSLPSPNRQTISFMNYSRLLIPTIKLKSDQ